MGCRMSREDESQWHIRGTAPTKLDNGGATECASQQLVTRANSTHYRSAHEAAMAEIFRAGNGLVGLQNLGELAQCLAASCHLMPCATHRQHLLHECMSAKSLSRCWPY